MKAWRADGPAELDRRVRRAVAVAGAGEIIVQELVPGDGRAQYAYCAFVQARSRAGEMTVRRRRQHPSDFGRASTYVETVDLPELERAVAAGSSRAIGYYGLVELEYKRDPRDGAFKLLDVNARTWGYHSLGVAAGVDFPYLLYARPIRRTPSPAEPRPRPRACGGSASRPICRTPAATSRPDGCRLRDYLRTLRGVDTEAVLSAGPAAVVLRARAAALSGRTKGAVMPEADNSVAFESTEPFAFFDYFRVPYRVVAGQDQGRGGRLGLLWPVPSAVGTLRWMRADGRVSRFELAGMQLAGCVVDRRGRPAGARLDVGAGGWRPGQDPYG